MSDDEAEAAASDPAKPHDAQAVRASALKILVGKWRRSNGAIYVFLKNGTGNGNANPFNWVLDGDTYTLMYTTHPDWHDLFEMVDATNGRLIRPGKRATEKMKRIGD